MDRSDAIHPPGAEAMTKTWVCDNFITGQPEVIPRNSGSQDRAYFEGWEDCMDGLEANCNPYRPETAEAKAWYEGWAAAERD